MATAPKAVPKVVPIEEAAAAPAPKKSKKKLMVMLVAALLLAGGGGGAAWYFLGGKGHADAHAKPEQEPVKPPVYVVMESFTVNLQPDGMGDQYLQVAFSLQVADQAQVDQLKLYMPLMRSRILLLLSGKKASDLLSIEGKKKLSDEIIAQVKLPVTPQSPPLAASGVFFTSFVIQ